MSMVYFFCQQVLLFSIPLIVSGMGGMFCERSGIVNIGIEGNMIIGAFCGAMFLNQGAFGLTGQWAFFVAMLISGAAGLLYSILHAFSCINLGANQAVSGIALNIAAPSAAIFIARLVIGRQQVAFNGSFRIEAVPLLSKIPVIGDIFFQKVYLCVYVGIVVFLIGAIVINKTALGMRISACGENPHAADSVGINVYRTRYIGVLTCGFLSGMAGIMLVLPTATEFNATVSGYGFLAVSVLILGQWKPRGILLASLFFGVMKTLSTVYSALPFLSALNIDAFYYRMIPFVVTLIVLAFSSKRTQGPLAAGQPYDKGAR